MNPHRKMDMVLKITFTWWLWWLRLAVVNPQINLLNSGCSQYNVSRVSNFYNNLNATFSDLRAQLNNSKYFATAQRVKGSEPVYAMAQCRKYLSNADCVACFTPLGRKFATALLPMVPVSSMMAVSLGNTTVILLWFVCCFTLLTAHLFSIL